MVVDDDATAVSDARFMVGVIEDNEKWNAHGICNDDISVCFEMSALCGWGATFSASRFKRAMRLLGDVPQVVRVGDRWFDHLCPTLARMDEEGHRTCGRVGCDNDITHLRANALFCGDRCKKRQMRYQTSE